MDKTNLIFLVLTILVVGFLAYSQGAFDWSSDTSNTSNTFTFSETGADLTLEAIMIGSVDAGDVAIELKPTRIIGSNLEMDISVNTHSVDLSSFDLKQITTLEFGGKAFSPIEAPSLGGHHVSGKLVFDAGEDLNNFVVKINGIPKINERVFNWR